MSEPWNPVSALQHWAATHPESVYLSQPAQGDVKDYTWAECLDQVQRVACYIESLDLAPGSAIAVLSSNCAQMVLADLAIWMSGHVSVPIYPSLQSQNLRYILSHSEARCLFLGNVDRWEEMSAGIPDQLPVITINGARHAIARAISWENIIDDDTRARAPAKAPVCLPNALARLVYTSGSTGQPKGVMCSFAALEASSNVVGHMITLTPSDRMLSYLPLAHVFEAAAVQLSSLRYGFRLYFNESLATFSEDLKRARPTVFLSVPRLWTKFQQSVLATIPQEKLDQLLSDPATAEQTREKILTGIGLQSVRVALTGSAPLAPAVMEWYRSLGLELLEGYAMSEDFAYSHVSRPGRSRIGYVGEAAPGVECRLSSSGEVLIKSPAGMLGYFKEPEKTAASYTSDGWFRTGDLGEVDEIGRLKITGRLKEIFKTSKGKYVAPVPIECRIAHPWVESVCVTGDHQPQPYALMMLSEAAREASTCNAARAGFEAEIAELLKHVNSALEAHEKLAFAVIVKDSWTIENGMLTPTMKIRRDVIERRYAEAVDTWRERNEVVVWEA